MNDTLGPKVVPFDSERMAVGQCLCAAKRYTSATRMLIDSYNFDLMHALRRQLWMAWLDSLFGKHVAMIPPLFINYRHVHERTMKLVDTVL
jgi:hypothetical protein